MMDESKEREAFERWYATKQESFGTGALTLALKTARMDAWLGRAALAQPEGWVLVPKEATTAMRVALWDTLSTTGGAHVAWRKALAVAPRTALAQPEPEPEPDADVLETSPPLVIRVRRHPEPEPELPEPAYFIAEEPAQHGMHPCFKSKQAMEKHGKEGVYHFAFTADQVRAAILADRKRREQGWDTEHKPFSKAVHDVLVERQRQIEEEGWTPEHDDKHRDGTLALAAAAYAVAGSSDGRCVGDELEPSLIARLWPWESRWWKPTGNRRRNLVKATALAFAAIECIDRAVNRKRREG